MMVVAHNLAAMNTQRQFGINSKSKAKSTEKLSSGYKVNRAADDAAGLSISEKMRCQIRGLSQATENVQDGISMVQIADGAMAEIHEMLDRGVELSVKAANGTLSEADREYIQEEIEHLKKEIDGISDRTKFNEIYVLRGEEIPVIGDTGGVVIEGSMPAWVAMGSVGQMQESHTVTRDFTLEQNGVLYSGTVDTTHEAATVDFSNFDGSATMVNELIGKGFYSTCCTCSNHYTIKFTEGDTSSVETSGEHYIYNIGIENVQNTNELLDRIIAGTDNGNPKGHYTEIVADKGAGKLILFDGRANHTKPTSFTATDSNGNSLTFTDAADIANVKWDAANWKHNDNWSVTAGRNNGKFGPGIATAEKGVVDYKKEIKNIDIHAGAEADTKINIRLPLVTVESIGLSDIDLSTQEGATKALDAFDNAIIAINNDRSRLGAYQNRMEHTINNLENVVENTTAAESQIRDTDMATEMVKYSNDSILEQVGHAMMAQANQRNQGVLQLLQ